MYNKKYSWPVPQTKKVVVDKKHDVPCKADECAKRIFEQTGKYPDALYISCPCPKCTPCYL